MTRINDFVAGRTPPELYETYLTPGLFAPWAEELVAAPPAGEAVLDLACGTGIVARTLAKTGAADIAAVDVAPPMIEHAKACAEKDGLDGRIDFRLAGAEALPFEDAAFDAVLCQQGVQFFPDKPAALSEARRILKPGGAFLASVWTAARDGNPVFEAFETIVAKHIGDDLVPFGPFSFGDKEALRALAEGAGLKVRALERRSRTARLPDIESLVLFDILFLGRPGADGALQPVIDAGDPASDQVVGKLIDEMKAALRGLIAPDGSLKAPMTAHVLIAET